MRLPPARATAFATVGARGGSDQMREALQGGVESVKQKSEFAKELSIDQPTILAVDETGDSSFAITSVMNVQNQVDGKLETHKY